MSKLTDQQLDELFKSHLLDFEKEPPIDSWSALTKEVSRNNFLKFNWKSFNIFYLGGIAIVSVSMITYFITSVNSSSNAKIVPAKKIIPVSQDTLTLQVSPSLLEKVDSKTTRETPVHLKEDILPETKPKPNSSLIQKDTVSSVLPEPVYEINKTEPAHKESSKPKKIITIIKRDTIRVKDTVNMKRIHW